MKWRSLEESKPGQQAATLREELEQRKALAEQYVPADVQEVNRRTVEELRTSGIAGRILQVGAPAPGFELPDQDGTMLSSASLLSRGLDGATGNCRGVGQTFDDDFHVLAEQRGQQSAFLADVASQLFQAAEFRRGFNRSALERHVQ